MPCPGAENAPPTHPHAAPRHTLHPDTSPHHTPPPTADTATALSAADIGSTDPASPPSAIGWAENSHTAAAHASNLGYSHHVATEQHRPPFTPGGSSADSGAEPPFWTGPGSASSEYIVSDEMLQMERGLMLPGWGSPAEQVGGGDGTGGDEGWGAAAGADESRR
jgi:hypothetical protein